LSLQERKALDEKKVTQRAADNTSWGEPAPVLPKRAKGDRLVGVHFAPEPYEDDEPAPAAPEPAAPEPHVDAVLAAPAAPPLDADLEAHFAAHFGDAPASKTPAAAHATVDPMLEAHFAGLAPAPSHVDGDAPSARCESCGGPAEAGNLCQSCQQAFQALLDTNAAQTAGTVEGTTAPVHELAVVPAERVAEEPVASPDADATVVGLAPATCAVETEPTVAAARAAAAPMRPVIPGSAVPSPVAPADAAPVAATSVIRVKTPPPPPDAPVEPVLPAKAPKPVAPVALAAVSPQRPSSLRTIGAAAAVVVVLAAIGFPLSRLWLGQESSPIIREEQPAAAPETSPVSAAASPAAPAPMVATASDAGSLQTPPKPVPAPPEPSTSAGKPPVAPKASASAGSNVTRPAGRVPPRGGRQPVTPVRQTAVAVPSSVAPPPAPEVAAPAPAAPAPAPAPAPPPAPVGPFFELRDVNETPRVATRVDPQVPDDLRDRQLNEVVIVRVLVTQTGHPLMINLLRKSKAGPSLDNAIVAAVKQWTFVPARRRGEAVSCWFHVGVPVTGAN
jgi:protein TonB